MTTDSLVPPIDTLELVSTSVSAKFLSPTVWTKLFVVFTDSFQVIGLLTEYDKFW